jgi:hypothetical protein
MALYGRDYLKRQLKQLALFLARAMGLQKRGRLDEARQELAQATSELVGMEPDVLGGVEPALVARLLASPDRLRVYAEIVRANAGLKRVLGDEDGARVLGERAAELLCESLLQHKDEETARVLREILSEHPGVRLGDRYRALVEEP